MFDELAMLALMKSTVFMGISCVLSFVSRRVDHPHDVRQAKHKQYPTLKRHVFAAGGDKCFEKAGL